MRKLIFCMGIAAGVFFHDLGMSEDIYMTFGKANGRYWMEMLGDLPRETARLTKTLYIQGFEDGLVTYENESPSARKMLDTLKGISRDDMVEALDNAFNDASNRSIPIHSMLALECVKMKEDISQEHYDAMLQEMRRRFAE